ncbi:MAG: DUF3256 family protein [Muribaculaceae bacterium]|nr:DUF3256 family protein [Muribaculaceae bacterium]
MNIKYYIVIMMLLCGIGTALADNAADTPASGSSAGFLASAKGSAARKTAADYFVAAPARVFPTIDSITRLDMIDYFRAGSPKPSRNLMGGNVRILADTPDHLEFSTSLVSRYTIDLLPSSGRPGGVVLMLTRTIQTPAEDSSVTFYTTGWSEIKGMFTVPTLDEWMLPEAKKKHRKEVENAVPFMLAKLEYAPDSQTMTFTNNLDKYIPEEDLGLANSSITKSLSYKWNGKRFVKLK